MAGIIPRFTDRPAQYCWVDTPGNSTAFFYIHSSLKSCPAPAPGPFMLSYGLDLSQMLGPRKACAAADSKWSTGQPGWPPPPFPLPEPPSPAEPASPASDDPWLEERPARSFLPFMEKMALLVDRSLPTKRQMLQYKRHKKWLIIQKIQIQNR